MYFYIIVMSVAKSDERVSKIKNNKRMPCSCTEMFDYSQYCVKIRLSFKRGFYARSLIIFDIWVKSYRFDYCYHYFIDIISSKNILSKYILTAIKKLTEKTETTLDDKLLKILETP